MDTLGYGAGESAYDLRHDSLDDVLQQPTRRTLWGKVKQPFAHSGLIKKGYTFNTDPHRPRPRTERFWVATKALVRFIYELIFGGKSVCCCIPTRVGVILASGVQFLVAGALSVALWFEVTTEHDFTFSHFDKVIFTCAGVFETVLFAAAVIGFIGAIVRKQLFITIYCAFLYIHFLANFGLASWTTWKINHVTNTDIRVACEGVLKDPATKDQCRHLLSDTDNFLLWIIWVVIVIELYGVLIATRYMRQLRKEKRVDRESYMGVDGRGSDSKHSHQSSGIRSLFLTEGSMVDSSEDTPFKTGGYTPLSINDAKYPFTNPTATFFPLAPSDLPTLRYNSSQSLHEDEKGLLAEHGVNKSSWTETEESV